MSEKKVIKPVALAVGAAIAGSFALAGAVNAHDTAESPFKMASLETGYMLGEHEEGSCGAKDDKKGEGACGEAGDKKGEGSCGEGSCGEAGDKKGEGKCGEGSCGEAGDKKGEGSCGDHKEGEGSCGGSA